MSPASEDHEDTPSEDELLEELEKELDDDFDSSGFREKRLQQLKLEVEAVRDLRENDHGKYTEVMREKQVIEICAQEKHCVVHFYHRNFPRCKIMDKHLETIAPRYYNTRFIRVFVENVPWLVEKLSIKVLPCVICFIDGVAKDRLVGFEELGNQDGFDTATLQLRLQMSGVLTNSESKFGLTSGSTIRTSNREHSDDDPFDLDE
ncbi:hypothetical protein Clacol_001679 [Clathrus columnatus]|uniref:Thioredoxin domain-containing protein n=1 Tax=Clathrus columnatus TaxID=1419009 RepID=A0AAV5A1J8_9AGAM|nr:hypothetical protein Clacol_001679 [Clathrus columnatus]